MALNSRTASSHGVLVRGGEPGDRIVAPVIHKTASAQEILAQERLTGQQLHRGHPQRLEVGDDRLRREPEVLAPMLGRHEGMQLCIALDVQLVDHRVAPGCRRRTIVLPVERRVRHLRAQRLLARQSSGVRIDAARSRDRSARRPRDRLPRAHGTRSECRRSRGAGTRGRARHRPCGPADRSARSPRRCRRRKCKAPRGLRGWRRARN